MPDDDLPGDDLTPVPDIGPDQQASASGAFSARPAYSLRCVAWINWQSGTRVSLHVELHVDGSWGSYSFYDRSTWDIYVQGAHIWHWGPGQFDFRSGTTRALHYGDVETNVYNDGRIDIDAYANFDVMGYAEAKPDVYGTPPRVPDAPTMFQPTNVTTTSMTSSFTGHGDGGSPIRSWTLQRATDVNFTQNVYQIGSWGTDQHTGLTPGTTYYFRSYGTNDIGNSPWSNTVSQQTLPAVPPGLTVAASPSGTSAVLTFSPPNGMTGVTKYTWERRATGTTSPVATGESTVLTTNVPNLVPGNSYDWRASAWFGTYQTPWTDPWVTLRQPKPNIDPGDYFDGDSVDLGDLDYSWAGTPHGSTSIATAKGVAGWAAYVNSGAAVLYRVTAGVFSPFAARVQFTADTTGDGNSFGQIFTPPYATEVTPGATYIGSIHVRPSRSQGLMAVIDWRTSAGAHISYTNGAGSLVAGETWSRLVAGAIAPEGAAWAAVRAMDVNIAGWSVWLGGDTLDLDGAMISLNEEFPYFDGSTLSDGTYLYEWDAEPHASVSTRTPVTAVNPSSLLVVEGSSFPAWLALQDPNCTPVPAPPRPPAIPSDCIEDVGVWFRYYAEIPSNFVPDWIDVVPTIGITTGSGNSHQVRIRYHENPDDLPPELVETDSWLAEQIISYVPASTRMVLDGVTQRVWAEIGGQGGVSADHLLYGTNGKPAVWPVLSCGISYLVTVDVPSDEPPGNIEIAAALTARV